MNYQEAWTFLDNLQFFKIKLGLDSMAMFLNELDSPEQQLKYVHVAGTNGKGSVAMTLLTLLSRAGYKVGLYTSPHLSSVRERFRINDQFISEEEFAREATRIHDILDGRQIMYFEFATALALLWFKRQQVDLAILEVGLGGRLDATNVITPLVSVITNVSMDHEAYLGDTLAEIAGEKAGIVKPEVPVVSGVGIGGSDDEQVVLGVVEDKCREQHAPLFLYGRDFFVEQLDDGSWDYWAMKRKVGCCKLREKISGLSFSLKGNYQMVNTGVALATLEMLGQDGFIVDDETIRAGLPEVSWPGRLESFCLARQDRVTVECGTPGAVHYLLDGAHNPAGVESLQMALANNFDYDRLILVWAAMEDKDISKTLPVIVPLADTLILTKVDYDRSAEPDNLKLTLPPEVQDKSVCESSLPMALDRAAELASDRDLVCIAGSLYMVGEARKLLLGEIV